MTQAEMTQSAELPSTGIPGVNADTGVVEDEAALEAYKAGNAPYPADSGEEYADYEDDYTDGAETHDFDVRLPRLVVVQDRTQDKGDAKTGQFLRRDTGEVFNEILAVPLHVKAQRKKYEPRFQKDQGATCFSADGMTTNITLEQHIALGCSSCKARWEGKEIPDRLMRCDVRSCPHFTNAPWADKPQDDFCRPGYGVALYDVTATGGEVYLAEEEVSGEVILLELYGMNSEAAAKFVGWGNAVVRGKARRIAKTLRQKSVRLTTKIVPTDNGDFPVIQVQTLGATDKAFIRDLYRDSRDVYVRALGEADDMGQQDALVGGGFTGSVTRDPEMQYTATGKAVTNFVISVSGEWYSVVAWEADAEWCNANVRVGQVVHIDGGVKAEQTEMPDGNIVERAVLTVRTIDVLEEAAAVEL